jgi:HK97 family phage major capsid protein
VVGYWIGEAGQLTPSKPKFRIIELGLKKCCVFVYATDELLSDATALEAFIRAVCPAELAFLVDDGILNGTGAGQLLGILNAGCLVQVAKETGQKAATIVAENVIKMDSRIIGTGADAVWLCNKNVKPQLYTMSLAVGTGGVPIYMPANGVSGLPYNTLFGRPVIFIEQAASLGTLGDIILADLKNGYILAEKGGVESAMSIHVRFDYDESVFRFILRADGQPVRASALTPYKGGASNTESHFVALQERA